MTTESQNIGTSKTIPSKHVKRMSGTSCKQGAIYRMLIFTTALSGLFSCMRGGSGRSFDYRVARSDFENSVLIDGVVEPIRSTTLACPMNVDGIITYLIDDGTYVNEGDVVCIIEDNNRQNEYQNLLISLETAKAELSKVKADLAMQYALLEAQVRNNKADTEIARLDSLQLNFATPTQRKIKELELERATIEKIKFERKLQALETINQSEIRKLELNIQQLTNRAESARKILDALTLKAPRKGLALVANSPMKWGEKLKVGDNVWNNRPVVSIPDVSEMKMKMMVSEADFKQINENNPVSYTFDALPGNTAYGKITKKMPVGQPHKRDSKVKFFEVEASIDSARQLPEPGLTANARVVVNSVADTLVIPRVAIFEEDSMKFVYVRKKKGFEARQIETGLASSKEAIVSVGLKEGEILSLIKPAPSRIGSRKLLGDSLHLPSGKNPL